MPRVNISFSFFIVKNGAALVLNFVELRVKIGGVAYVATIYISLKGHAAMWVKFPMHRKSGGGNENTLHDLEECEV